MAGHLYRLTDSPQLLCLVSEIVHVTSDGGVRGILLLSFLCLVVGYQLPRVLTDDFSFGETAGGHHTSTFPLHLHHLVVRGLTLC